MHDLPPELLEPSPPPAEAASSPDHDGKGRLSPGNSLWKKRDPLRHQLAVREALERRVSLEKSLLKALTDEDVRRVVERLVSIITDGKDAQAVQAAKVLLAHSMPRQTAPAESAGGGGSGPTFVFQLPADPVERARRRVANEAGRAAAASPD
jgi:hypothetical protein